MSNEMIKDEIMNNNPMIEKEDITFHKVFRFITKNGHRVENNVVKVKNYTTGNITYKNTTLKRVSV